MLNPTDLRPSARQGCSHADSHALGACWFLRPAPTWSGRDDAALDHSVNHNGARGHAEGCDGHTTPRPPCPALQAQLQGTTPANHPSATQLQLQLMVFTSLDSSVQLHGLHGLLQQVPPAKGHPVMGANHGTPPKTRRLDRCRRPGDAPASYPQAPLAARPSWAARASFRCPSPPSVKWPCCCSCRYSCCRDV